MSKMKFTSQFLILLVLVAPCILASSVDRQRAGYTEVPVELIVNTTTNLYLQYNLITEIKANTFNGFDRLFYIDLSHNRISAISDSAFNGTRLSSLLINYNRLTTLPTFGAVGSTLSSLSATYNQIYELRGNIFNGLTRLNTLNLYNNQIERMGGDVFNGLTRLTTLNLYNNQIKRFGGHVFNGLTRLTTLNLYNNQIERLGADDFNGLTRLTTLNLYNNKIARLRNDVFNGLAAVTTLNLHHNLIERLESDSLRHLPALTTLYLQYNQMTSIASDVLAGISAPLSRLHISNNRLTDIDFLGSPNLSVDNQLANLYLGNNFMVELPPKAFERLINVHKLSLVGMGLTEIPDLINQKLNLRYLHLSWNFITVIRKDAFDGFNLVRLDVDNNRLVDVSYLFHPLISITTLYLNDNNIGPIDISHINRPITGLTSLYLQNNNLGAMPCDSMMMFLELLPELKILYLQSTGLETFPDISMLNHRLTRLYLLNPRTMRCDCSLDWMRNITQMVMYTDISITSHPCLSPRRLVGFEWGQVTKEDLCKDHVFTSCGRYNRTLSRLLSATTQFTPLDAEFTPQTEQPTQSVPIVHQSGIPSLAIAAVCLGLLLIVMVMVVIVLLVRRKSPALQDEVDKLHKDGTSAPNTGPWHTQSERTTINNTYEDVPSLSKKWSV